jgi:hypothetical protein
MVVAAAARCGAARSGIQPSRRTTMLAHLIDSDRARSGTAGMVPATLPARSRVLANEYGRQNGLSSRN